MDKKKILVADDEKDLTFLISEILEAKGGFDVHVARDGKEAMEKVVEIQPDIVFLDFVMPEVKGDGVLAFINEHCDKKKTAIVLMSGLGERVYFGEKNKWQWLPKRENAGQRGGVAKPTKWKRSPEEIAREFGIKAFLPKPFSRETLLEVLQAVSSDGEQETCVLES